jgi:hypothetical protein
MALKKQKAAGARIYRRSSKVLYKQLATKIAILRQNDLSGYYQVDRHVADLWLLLDGRRTIHEIAMEIAKKSKLSSDRINRETETAITRLYKNQLIELVKN